MLSFVRVPASQTPTIRLGTSFFCLLPEAISLSVGAPWYWKGEGKQDRIPVM